jgi:hypothetical protein
VRGQNEKADMSTLIKCIALIFYKYLKAEGPKQSSTKYHNTPQKIMNYRNTNMELSDKELLNHFTQPLEGRDLQDYDRKHSRQTHIGTTKTITWSIHLKFRAN